MCVPHGAHVKARTCLGVCLWVDWCADTTYKTTPPTRSFTSAISFEVSKGQIVKTTDIMRQQVAEFIAFNRNDLREKLSTGRTRSENRTIRITKGHRLFSNRNNVLFMILQDTCGVHDLLYPPCSRWVFEHRYKIPPARQTGLRHIGRPNRGRSRLGNPKGCTFEGK